MEKVIEQLKRDSLALDKLNRTVSVQGTRQKIRLPGRMIHTVFYPAEQKNAPVIFAFHGGGFVLGGCALDDALHHTFSKTLSANLVSVGYRKGERNPFPKAVNDAYDAVKYYLDDMGDEYHFDHGRVATFGSSAGANLAVATGILAQRRKEFRVGMQILNYPFLDMATPPRQKGYLADELVKAHYFNEAYAEPSLWTDPLVSPVLAADEDFDKTMSVIVTLADIDPLRTEGESYAQHARRLGLSVAERVSPGQVHGYLECAFRDLTKGWCPPPIRAAADDGSLYAERDATVQFIKEQWQEWLSA